MKLAINKIVEQGRERVEYRVDGEPSKYGRTLTGHTGGIGSELFAAETNVLLEYGRHSRTFSWNNLPTKDTVGERLEKILERVRVVREWVSDCRARDAAASGEIEAEIADVADVLTAMQAEKRLYYRATDGKFRRLE